MGWQFTKIGTCCSIGGVDTGYSTVGSEVPTELIEGETRASLEEEPKTLASEEEPQTPISLAETKIGQDCAELTSTRTMNTGKVVTTLV